MAETATEIDDEILRPDRLADPYPYFAQVLAAEPVRWNQRYRAWFVHKHEDVLAALRNPVFSSDRVRPVYEERLSDRARAERAPTFDVLRHWLVFMDPPEHTRLRKLVMPAFSPKAVEQWRPRVEQVVGETIAALDGRDSFDLVRDLAYPIPAVVIAELMGVPAEDRDRFKQWSDDILVLVFGAEGEGNRERAQRGLVELTGYLRALVARYRADPGDNLISRLALSREADPPLTEDETVATCALLIFGGHETTTNLIANGTRALLAHPDQLTLLREEPARMRVAVEELLRYDGPSRMEVRRLTADVELRGKTMRAGDTVYLAQSAANRDPDVFDDPDRLDITREPNRHVGFGFGLHHCLGNFLARLEASVAISAIIRQMPDLSAGPRPPEFHPTLISRGMSSFPVSRTGGPS